MKRYLFITLMSASFSLFSQPMAPTTPPTTATPAKPATTPMPAMAKSAAVAAPASDSRSVMMIDPKARASDLMKAFDLFRKEKTSPKVFFELRSGKQISNVIEMSLLPEGTLILFRYATPQGILLEIAGVEDVVNLYHQ